MSDTSLEIELRLGGGIALCSYVTIDASSLVSFAASSVSETLYTASLIESVIWYTDA